MISTVPGMSFPCKKIIWNIVSETQNVLQLSLVRIVRRQRQHINIFMKTFLQKLYYGMVTKTTFVRTVRTVRTGLDKHSKQKSNATN